MPVMRYNSVRRSNAGAFRLLFLPLGLGPMGRVWRSTLEPRDSGCFSQLQVAVVDLLLIDAIELDVLPQHE